MMTDEKEGISLDQLKNVISEVLDKKLSNIDRNDKNIETHKAASHMKYCPDCGDKNPNYSKKHKICNDCETILSNESSRCSNCGGSDIESEEDEDD